jgi:ApbE superfamily uncharacterized protein (UPF0280 family)
LKTTFANGPGQPAGGAYENGTPAYCANVALTKSLSTHGLSFGRGTGASAVTVFAEPMSPGDASAECIAARRAEAAVL